jgi:phosphoribosylamine-glycine ligase
MIEIADWVVIAFILAAFTIATGYLLYFIITRKLFPKEIEFNTTVNPNETLTVLSIKGQGIIKKIEAKIENNNALIDMIIDQTSYATFDVAKETNHPENSLSLQDKLKFEVQLDNHFHKEFSISINNRNNTTLNASGKISYEIKRPLGVTIKSLYRGTNV